MIEEHRTPIISHISTKVAGKALGFSRPHTFEAEIGIMSDRGTVRLSSKEYIRTKTGN